MESSSPSARLPRVVIIGGGFGGLAAAKALAKAPVSITIVDRRNHHVFQPLLYQVASAALSPADISAPIRHAVHKVKNCQVIMGQPSTLDVARKKVVFSDTEIDYDYLIVAAGATHSYFGHDNWADLAPGLKTLEDATEMRRRILLAFEYAEYEASVADRRSALTFAIIGGGPTGVELAGAIKEIAATTLPADFRNIDTTSTRVMLFEGGDRILPAFDPVSSRRALHDLEAMGVEVRCNAIVTDVKPEGVHIGAEFVPVRTVFWAAGVRASSLGACLGAPLDKAGRVLVEADCSITGHPEIFVIGDMASVKSADTGVPVPGVAQGAMQMGKHVGRIIAKEVRSKAGTRMAFSYNDKGNMATIGRSKAVAEIGGMKFGGIFAWLLWGLIHVNYLVNYRNRVVVFASWLWNWFVFSRDARLILGSAKFSLRQPPTPGPGNPQ